MNDFTLGSGKSDMSTFFVLAMHISTDCSVPGFSMVYGLIYECRSVFDYRKVCVRLMSIPFLYLYAAMSFV